MKIIQGNLDVSSRRFAIILSRFNEEIGQGLLDGALACLKKYNCPEENIDLIKVPGAFEIPEAAEKLAEQNYYQAIICLGAVIRGGTPHFEYIAANASSGIMQVSLKHGIPVVFGVLTTDTYEQAVERSLFKNSNESINKETGKETGSGNKGWDAALTAIEMTDLFDKFNEQKPF